MNRVTDRDFRQRAIVALISHRTVGEAAQALGVSYDTLTKIKRDPDFIASYNRASDAYHRESLRQLAVLSVKGVQALSKNLDSDNEMIRNQAAKIVFSVLADPRPHEKELDELRQFAATVRRAITIMPPEAREAFQKAASEAGIESQESWEVEGDVEPPAD